jgi:RHS repeat-associated protein
VTTGYGTADASDDVATTYTNNGSPLTVTDAEGNRTTYEYDGHDRLAKTRYPSPTTDGVSSTTDYEQPTYDAAGNVTAVRLRDGQSIALTYDNLNRVTLKNLPGSEPDVSYTYDLLGRMTFVQQGTLQHHLAYDALGRLLSEAQPFGSSAYQYDLAGRRTRLTWQDGFYVTYDYDVTGNVTAIRENGATSGIGVLAIYAYDDLGRRTGITRGNGAITAYTFDPVSRLTSLTQNLAGTVQDLTLGFSYNPASQIASSTRSNDAYAWGGHVNVDRPYVTNGLNQHTASGAVALGYDARGNLTSSGASSYTYSSENLMKSASGGVTLHYDGFGRLHEYNTSISTRFMYDGLALSAEIANPSGAILRRYVHGPGTDEPLVWYEGSGTTDRRWLHADERGSIIAISNASGTVTNVNSYDEYGIPAAANTGRFQYTGQTWLPELGMYYYKARIYSPTLGRFMQSDPIGYQAGMNLNAYVGNDPINWRDPLGLCQDEGDTNENATKEDCDIVVTAPSRGGGGGGSGTSGSGGNGTQQFIPEPETLQNVQCPAVSPGNIGNRTEIGNAMTRPGWQVINAKRAADISSGRAAANFPASQLWNGRGDAWRHFRWNFSMAQSMGSRVASAFANAHEVSGQNDPAELAMDLQNNAMGRAFAESPAAKGMTADAAANLALRSGCLQTAPK